MTTSRSTTGAAARRAPIGVLVVASQPALRDLLVAVLGHDVELTVAGACERAGDVIPALERTRPDVVTLCIELPDGDGLSVLRDIQRTDPSVHVIIVSAVDDRTATLTLDALAAGAADHVISPSELGNARQAAAALRETLVPRIKAICGLEAHPVGTGRTDTVGTRLEHTTDGPGARRPDVVAIGASTGGPKALTAILSALPTEFDRPVLITQHLPPVFTRYLAERLDDVGDLQVREARHGDLVEPGVALLAPGDVHLGLERTPHGVAVSLTHTPPVQFHRPSVDVMLRSVAAVYGGDAVAVILSGMGRDGLDGCRALRDLGGIVLVQDPGSSVVWGMPGAVHAAGLADAVVPAEQMADAITTAVQHARIASPR